MSTLNFTGGHPKNLRGVTREEVEQHYKSLSPQQKKEQDDLVSQLRKHLGVEIPSDETLEAQE